jgi:hypothetical protein
MTTMQLSTLEEATRMLAKCATVDEAKKIRDLAEAARVYAREADLGAEAQNHAAEIKLRAEQRCGAILAQMAEDGERASRGNTKQMSHVVTLPELGIDRNESYKWQKLAQADAGDFEDYIAEQKEAGAPITTAGAIRYLSPSEQRDREDRATELFAIYRAIEAIATFDMKPKAWAKLDHGSSRYRVDQHLDAAIKWLSGLREIWQTD